MRDTIVSLSTIPPRFGDLGPTLGSILAQSLPVREIRLYIPLAYRRFPDWDGTLPKLPAGVTIHRCNEDLGPATKVLPAVRDLRGQQVDILFCDDDKLYDPDWHARFKEQAALRPGVCIVEAGETFPDIVERPAERLPRMVRRPKDWRYRLVRVATLGRIKPRQYLESGYVDQISGWAGVLVQPDWFTDDAFQIPDILWTVDDLWLSGQLELSGIPIWLNAAETNARSLTIGRTHALLDFVEQGHGRVDADLAAIDYFRDKYGIWPKSDARSADRREMTKSMRRLAERTRTGS